MSLVVKISLGALVLVVIVGGVYWYLNMSKAPASPGAETGTEQPTATGDSANTLPTGSAPDDDSLAQDLDAISTQMGTFTGDDTNVTQSLADQPVQQSSL